MKKILIIITLVVGLTACHNEENSFPDYSYTSAYFPYQYPVRTLVLGDYIYDNTNDNNHQFLISAAFGGVYSNNQDRVLDIKVDESLCNKVLFPSTDTMRLMPSSYYTLSSTDKLIIPKGKFNGNIVVQLNEAFFNDPLAIKGNYVIPVRIIGATGVDSLLHGIPAVSNADCRVVAQWAVVPKDFTMFSVKYINPYHGKYLHRGKSLIKNVANNLVEDSIYRHPYNVDDEIWSMVTSGKNQVKVQGSIKSLIFKGQVGLILNFDQNGNCTVTGEAGSAKYAITGTGKFADDADTWGNKKRDAIHLNYQFTDGTNTYSATDTLVIRDRGVVMEVYTPTVF